MSIRFIFIFIILESLYMLSHAINGILVFLLRGFYYFLLDSHIAINGYVAACLDVILFRGFFWFEGLCWCMFRCYFVQRVFFVRRVMLLHA